MSAENAKEMVELLGDITQVGIVIEDMEKAKAGMLKVFGLKPDAESDNLYKKTWYRGEIIEVMRFRINAFLYVAVHVRALSRMR